MFLVLAAKRGKSAKSNKPNCRQCIVFAPCGHRMAVGRHPLLEIASISRQATLCSASIGSVAPPTTLWQSSLWFRKGGNFNFAPVPFNPPLWAPRGMPPWCPVVSQASRSTVAAGALPHAATGRLRAAENAHPGRSIPGSSTRQPTLPAAANLASASARPDSLTSDRVPPASALPAGARPGAGAGANLAATALPLGGSCF